ncbi:MAG: hypothetical protein BWY94_01806 [Actinobacteria bacterium ADurb.BinA094]|nr:MAG: hypothetical protein BWY94_01806 [Actinobacteria bacterium ADurb.BinA094]
MSVSHASERIPRNVSRKALRFQLMLAGMLLIATVIMHVDALRLGRTSV